MASSPSISSTMPRRKKWVPADACPVYGKSGQNKAETKNRPMLDRKQLITAYPPQAEPAQKKNHHCGPTHCMYLEFAPACPRAADFFRGAGNVKPKHVRVQNCTKKNITQLHPQTLGILEKLHPCMNPKQMFRSETRSM